MFAVHLPGKAPDQVGLTPKESNIFRMSPLLQNRLPYPFSNEEITNVGIVTDESLGTRRASLIYGRTSSPRRVILSLKLPLYLAEPHSHPLL